MVSITGTTGVLLHGVVLESSSIPALFGLEDDAGLQLEHVTIVGKTLGGVVRWHGIGSEVIVNSTVLDETKPVLPRLRPPGSAA
jgi:hypothetical protein